MSVSYYSNPVKNASVTVRDENVENFSRQTGSIEFTKKDEKTENKSVDIYYFEDRIVVNFYGYTNQREVNQILKAFSVMLDTKFVNEEDFENEENA